MDDFIVRQGDQYSLSFPIKLDNFILTTHMLGDDGDIEIIIGKIVKTYRKNEVKFNPLLYTFDFPLTQEETFKWRAGMRLKSQVRVKLKKFREDENNVIYSYDGPDVVVLQSMSRNSI